LEESFEEKRRESLKNNSSQNTNPSWKKQQ